MSSDYAAWRDRLSEANDPAFWPIEEIDRLLFEGHAQFWCDGAAAVVSHVVAYPGGAKAVEILAAAGKLEAIRDVITPEVIGWGQSQGLSHLLVAGRPGWARVYKGWRHYQSILLKELADGQ